MAGDPTTLDLERLVATRHEAAGRAGEPLGRGAWHGAFRGHRHGQGMDFEDLRPYADGDDVRHVDWRASARLDAVHTRLYREEREHVVTIGVDLRGSMFTGSATLRSVEAGLLAAALCWRASGGGSRVGVATLDDDGVRVSRPGGGERGALDGCRLIGETFARARGDAGASGPASLETLITGLERGGRRVGASIVVGGFDDPGDGFDAALVRLSTARPLAFVIVADALERRAPPSGRYRYRGADGERTVTLGRRERQLLDASLSRRRATIDATFADAGVPSIDAASGVAAVARALRDGGFLP